MQAKKITFTQGRATFTVRANNAHRVRDALFALEHGKARKFRQPTGSNVQYPAFVPGMTTAEYIHKFHTLNSSIQWVVVDYVHAQRKAPTLDPLIPEVLEETDPDYIPAAKPKARKPSASRELAALVREALQFAPPEWQARALDALS